MRPFDPVAAERIVVLLAKTNSPLLSLTVMFLPGELERNLEEGAAQWHLPLPQAEEAAETVPREAGRSVD